MYDKVREPRPKNCEKIMKGGRGARRKFTFYQSVSFLEKKKYSRAVPRPPFKPGPPDICQVCQVGHPALDPGLVTMTEVGILLNRKIHIMVLKICILILKSILSLTSLNCHFQFRVCKKCNPYKRLQKFL